MQNEHFDDPVAAYDRLAPQYAGFANRRDAYLRAVETIIIGRLPGATNSLLDIGAGDGSRALRIAASAGIRKIVLVEPSAGMIPQVSSDAEIWRIRAENLNAGTISERFDVITCLWNSLGHVPEDRNRRHALLSMAQLLSPHGKLFLDVNHRYNAQSYGVTATCARWLKDTIHRDPRNGDVTANWKICGARVSTYGHVFTHREIVRLAQGAGLDIAERVVLDYENGSVRRLSSLGNLLYIFSRSSRIESSSAPATS